MTVAPPFQLQFLVAPPTGGELSDAQHERLRAFERLGLPGVKTLLPSGPIHDAQLRARVPPLDDPRPIRTFLDSLGVPWLERAALADPDDPAATSLYVVTAPPFRGWSVVPPLPVKLTACAGCGRALRQATDVEVVEVAERERPSGVLFGVEPKDEQGNTTFVTFLRRDALDALAADGLTDGLETLPVRISAREEPELVAVRGRTTPGAETAPFGWVEHCYTCGRGTPRYGVMPCWSRPDGTRHVFFHPTGGVSHLVVDRAVRDLLAARSASTTRPPAFARAGWVGQDPCFLPEELHGSAPMPPGWP